MIEACALGPDLDMLPGRDMVEIGEKVCTLLLDVYIPLSGADNAAVLCANEWSFRCFQLLAGRLEQC